MFHRKKQSNRSFIFASLVTIFASGCSSLTPTPAPLATAASQDSRYTLNILEEVNDGSRLYVTAQIDLAEKLSDQHVLVRLRAMADGSPVGEAFVPLTGENRTAQDADLYQVKMSVEAKEFTDYQLDLIWGPEAVAYLQSLPREEIIKVSDLKLIKGKIPKITGRFENRGIVPVTQLTALVQLAWVPEGDKLDLSDLKAENDTEVEVPGLSIAPGSSKDFSIDLEISIPAEKGGSYQPVVRIKDEPRSTEPTRSDSSPPTSDGE